MPVCSQQLPEMWTVLSPAPPHHLFLKPFSKLLSNSSLFDSFLPSACAVHTLTYLYMYLGHLSVLKPFSEHVLEIQLIA